MPDHEIEELDPDRIKIFVHRDRDPEAHRRAIADTKRRGQIEPGEVRDIRHLPEDERRRPDGGLYWYGLIVGEGRLLRAKALGRPFRAYVVQRKELEVVGRFLSENLNRVALPWAQKAKLIQPRLQAGESHASIARSLSLSVGHVNKLVRVLNKTAEGLEDDVASMPMPDAEVFTALTKKEQKIVMQEFRETRESSIQALVKVARRVTEETDKELSALALKKELRRIDEDLQRMRERLKLTRLHHSISVLNLVGLLEDKKFRQAIERTGVNVLKFEKLVSQE